VPRRWPYWGLGPRSNCWHVIRGHSTGSRKRNLVGLVKRGAEQVYARGRRGCCALLAIALVGGALREARSQDFIKVVCVRALLGAQRSQIRTRLASKLGDCAERLMRYEMCDQRLAVRRMESRRSRRAGTNCEHRRSSSRHGHLHRTQRCPMTRFIACLKSRTPFWSRQRTPQNSSVPRSWQLYSPSSVPLENRVIPLAPAS
jgi:hypothetical protein